MKELTINSLIEVVVTEKVLEKHPARDWGYLYRPTEYPKNSEPEGIL